MSNAKNYIYFLFILFNFYKEELLGRESSVFLDAPHVRVILTPTSQGFRSCATRKSFRSAVERVLGAPHVRVILTPTSSVALSSVFLVHPAEGNLDTDCVRLLCVFGTHTIEGDLSLKARCFARKKKRGGLWEWECPHATESVSE